MWRIFFWIFSISKTIVKNPLLVLLLAKDILWDLLLTGDLVKDHISDSSSFRRHFDDLLLTDDIVEDRLLTKDNVKDLPLDLLSRDIRQGGHVLFVGESLAAELAEVFHHQGLEVPVQDHAEVDRGRRGCSSTEKI